MEGFCRGCLVQYNEPTDLMPYTEKNRRLFVYSTGIQVKRNDAFTFQLCKQCYLSMKLSCKFKKLCRTSDKQFKNFLMLKEEGDDFASFIQNSDEKTSFRLPLASGHSTPANHKNRDDDNESTNTNTSIHNFFTDILDGEEMAPTDSRIIREVIEEEADVMDDSLDSHWLQDDMSVASDLDVDFSFTPFGTPRSVQNNDCFTPKKIHEAKQRELKHLTSKEIIEEIDKPKLAQKSDMPLLDDMDLDKANIKVEDIKVKCTDDDKVQTAPNMNEFDNSIPSEVEDMVTENSISSVSQCFETDLLADLAVKKQMDILEYDSCNFTYDETEIVAKKSKDTFKKKVTYSETKESQNMCIVLNQGVAEKVSGGSLANDYVHKVELKKQISSAKDLNEYHCTIDRNLPIALKNGGNNEFSLDQLIVTPAVSIPSGVPTPTNNNILNGDKDTGGSNATSTPTIKNILFGEKNDTKSATNYFPQVGQSIESIDDNINDLEAFFKPNEKKIKDDCKNYECAIKFEPDDTKYSCRLKEEIDKMKTGDHADVLEQFLQGESPKVNEEIMGQIIDPQQLTKEPSEQHLFKRPLTPCDKYDLVKNHCKICNRPFNTPKSLKIHFTKTHNYKIPSSDPHRNRLQNSKIKMCDICGKDVKGSSNYLRHKQAHRNTDVERTHNFECDVCTMTFETRLAIVVHMRSHKNMKNITEKQKSFVCAICGKVSATSSGRRLHMRRHLKQISARCEVCDKGFYTNSDMKLHVRLMHEGERPFKCQHCDKRYKRRNALYLHLKRHLGKYEYKCTTCDVAFISKEILTQHYGSKKCVMGRQEISRKLNEEVPVLSVKGSLEKIKRLMCRDITEHMEPVKEDSKVQESKV